jgi:type 1 fimbriae regulatory protein FimE
MAKKSGSKKRLARKSRDYVLPREMDRVLRAALGNGRHAHRNYTLILLCYRHGLRAGEVRELRWSMVDFNRKQLRVKRMLNGIDSVHPLHSVELKALRQLKREYPDTPYLFITDRGKKLSEKSVQRIVAGAGTEARLSYPLHAQMLRHGCGHALASAGHRMVAIQHYLGHRNIRHTLRYMELPSHPFRDFWKD